MNVPHAIAGDERIPYACHFHRDAGQGRSLRSHPRSEDDAELQHLLEEGEYLFSLVTTVGVLVADGYNVISVLMIAWWWYRVVFYSYVKKLDLARTLEYVSMSFHDIACRFILKACCCCCRQVGYLAVTLCLHDKHELILLLINTLQRDLKHENVLCAVAALSSASRLGKLNYKVNRRSHIETAINQRVAIWFVFVCVCSFCSPLRVVFAACLL